MKDKKILIFGFKPYGRYKTNISEIIVNKIRNKKIGKKIILPTAFDRNKIIKKLKEIKPDIILGMSQHPRARKIRIERKAKNIIKLKKEKIPENRRFSGHRKSKGFSSESRLINKNSKSVLFTNLKIKKINGITITYNAGTYVCNFVMFIIMDHIRKNNKDTKFAFLHIPKDYSIRKGINTINKITNNININKV